MIRLLLLAAILAITAIACDRETKQSSPGPNEKTSTSTEPQEPTPTQKAEQARQEKAMEEEIERARKTADAQRDAEKKRLADLREVSKKPTKTIDTIKMEDATEGNFDITITDTCIQVKQTAPAAGQTSIQDPWETWYGGIHRFIEGTNEFTTEMYSGRGVHIKFKTSEEYAKVLAEVKTALGQWNAKYSEVRIGY